MLGSERVQTAETPCGDGLSHVCIAVVGSQAHHRAGGERDEKVLHARASEMFAPDCRKFTEHRKTMHRQLKKEIALFAAWLSPRNSDGRSSTSSTFSALLKGPLFLLQGTKGIKQDFNFVCELSCPS